MCSKECAEQMNRLWHKGTVVMKMTQAGLRAFVKLVMQQLQRTVVDSLKADGKPWDCASGPEKMDSGPHEIHVTSIDKEGVFLCREKHEFQVSSSFDVHDATALQVVYPSADAAAAGFFDGQVIYVCRSATRALPEEASSTAFKCQTGITTHQIQPFLTVFQCTVQSSPPVSFDVMASDYDPTNSKFVAQPGAASLPVKLWTVSPNEKKAGFFNRKVQKISDKFDVTFSAKGSGLPPSIVAGRAYRPTCIKTASFELMPELLSFDADWNFGANPLQLRRMDTAQRCVRGRALKHHEKGETAVVKWASIRSQELSKNPNDFGKMFCSASKDNVDVFETETNGELLFNMMTFCTEFMHFHEFLSPNMCFDSDWTAQRSSFSLQSYWKNSRSGAVALKEPSTKLKEFSAKATAARNDLMHSDFEITVKEFEGACSAFVGLLEEVVRICSLLVGNAAAKHEMRSELTHAIVCAQEKLKDIRERLLSREVSTLQEQRENINIRKQFQMERQRAEQLELENKSLLLHIEEQQEHIEGNRESLRASLSQIASFSKAGDQDINLSSQRWASGSRQHLLDKIHDAAAGKHSSVVCVHGHHGCGKSSALSKVVTQLRDVKASGTLVLSFVFKFGDAASSVDAAMASLCVQLWEHALGEVSCCCFHLLSLLLFLFIETLI